MGQVEWRFLVAGLTARGRECILMIVGTDGAAVTVWDSTSDGAAFFPSFNFSASPTTQSLYGLQQTPPWGHTAGLVSELPLSLNWTVFDGGARRNKLAQAEANVHAAKAEVDSTRNQIADDVWTAYSNWNTAVRQSQAAIALLRAAHGLAHFRAPCRC